jgi:hypothetical protein
LRVVAYDADGFPLGEHIQCSNVSRLPAGAA